MRISDWSSDVCSSDLAEAVVGERADQFGDVAAGVAEHQARFGLVVHQQRGQQRRLAIGFGFEEHLLDGRRLASAADAYFYRVAPHRVAARTDGFPAGCGAPQPLPVLRLLLPYVAFLVIGSSSFLYIVFHYFFFSFFSFSFLFFFFFFFF